MKLLTSVVAMVLARLSAGLVATAAAASSASPRCVMYLTGQHPVTPDAAQMARVSHVLLAFLPSDMFNGDAGDERTTWPLFTSVDDVRRRYPAGGDADAAKVMVAIGGWGDTRGFSAAARSAAARRRFARNVARMVAATGADGVDVDWEYPGGNGEDYKQVPNGDKAWEVEAYPLLMAELRAALGPRKLLSAAVPGKPGDMLAFTRTTVPRIMNHVDFLNVMTYDLMNRRDNVTKHHTGLQDSIAGLDAYIQAGAAPQNLNLGFAFYTKWVKTEHAACLKGSPIGCPTLLLEDPETGADLGRTGGFAWHDPVPEDLEASFARAKSLGRYDESGGGGYYYWDGEEDLWWTFDTPDAIARKFPAVVEEMKVGGVFAWGLGEDAPEFEHLAAVLRGLERHGAAAAAASKNEL